MRIGPLRSYAPSIRRKLLLGAVSSVVLTTFFPGAVLAADFTQSKYRMGVTGTEVTNPALLPGWNFSRASAGYAETKDGQLVAFPANEPRITDKGLLIEEARTNTILNSLAIGGSGWNLLNASAALNSLVAPDGSLTASAITNTGSTVGGFYRQSGTNLSASQSYTTSGFFRYVSGGTTVQLIVASQSVFGGSGGDRYITFDVTTGQLVTKSAEITSYTITRYANGWWRVSGTFTPTSTGISNVGAYSTSAASIFGAWGLQFETGSFVTSYIATTSAAATRAADNAYITGLGSILGQFRTNLARYSTDTTSAQWAVTNAAKTPGKADPFGGSGAALFAADGTTAIHSVVSSSPTVPYVAGTVYTLSRMLKAGTQSLLQLTGTATIFGGGQYANFDLSAGIVTASVGLAAPATITAIGGGYYRVSITVTATASGMDHGGGVAFIASPTSGRAPTNSLATNYFDFGAMVEVGTEPSPFIVTTASPASAGNPFTIAASADLPLIDGVARTLATADDSSVNNRVRLSRNASNQGQFAATVAGMGQTSLFTNGFSGSILLKMATRVKSASYSGVVNGAASSAGITAPTGLNRIRFGFDADGNSSALNGYLQRVVILGDVDDTTLQTLTT